MLRVPAAQQANGDGGSKYYNLSVTNNEETIHSHHTDKRPYSLVATTDHVSSGKEEDPRMPTCRNFR